ncbi:MAG TPA: HAD family phosphatase [Candidatus Paceibacterota bacterium]
MIKTVIFDIGGVITHTDFEATYRNFGSRIGVSPDLVLKYCHENFKQLILGSLSFEDFCSEMRKSGADASLDLKQVLIEEMSKVRKIDEAVLETIRLLRKNYSVGTLTNLTESRFITDEATGLYTHFDYRVLSYVEHMEKPNPTFYQIALDRAGVMAEEAVFVDDTEKCILAAQSMGMKTVHFADNVQLVEELGKCGVVINT